MQALDNQWVIQRDSSRDVFRKDTARITRPCGSYRYNQGSTP